GSFVEILKQPLFVLIELEVIIFFLAKFDLSPFGTELAIWAAFLVSQELFLADRVVTSLFVLIDLALVEEPLQDSLNNFLLPIARRLGPFIVFHFKFLRQIEPLLRDSFDEFSWRNTCLRCRLLDLLSVLIDAGQEKYIFTLEPVIARDHIG